jgi:hypothetical protein
MEPEREIEKLLRTYARKRRDDAGAPPELHPATRRLLQSEVARCVRKPGKRGFVEGLFAALRPRLAVAAGAFAIALIAGALVFFALGKRETQLAFDRSSPAPAPQAVAERPAAAPLPASPPLEARRGTENIKVPAVMETEEERPQALKPEIARAHREAFEDRLAGTAGRGRTADAAGTMEDSTRPTRGFSITVRSGDLSRAVTQENGDVPTQTLRQNDGKSALAPGAYSAPEPSVANTAEHDKALLVDGAEKRMKAANTLFQASQRYLQVESASGKGTGGQSEPAAWGKAAVLNAFELEQTGGEIRVVDDDGSVYSGSLQLANQTALAGQPQGQTASFGKNGPSQEARQELTQNYFFRVSGTNRSLQQNVVFNGNLLMITEGPALSNLTNATPFKWNQAQTLSNLSGLPLANSRISGTAVIDNIKEIQINALPAKP